MRIGVVTFPGSLDDRDAARAVRECGGESVPLWHGDDDLRGVDAVILPGGFSYGDYLRCGAIARFAPVMDVLVPAAQGGLPVLGICNGFQVLTESHLLPVPSSATTTASSTASTPASSSRTPRRPGPPTTRSARRSRSC